MVPQKSKAAYALMPFINMMDFFNRITSICSEYLFPSGCSLCGAMLIEPDEICNGLCESCGHSIQIEEGERCLFCGKPLISETGLCLDCREINIEENDVEGQETSEKSGRRKKPAYDRLISIFPYTGKYRELLWAFKYGKSKGAARFFSEKIIEALEPFKSENPVLIPVPPRPGKIRKTGWDQIKCLSKILKRKAMYQISPCLVRLASDSQKKLKEHERRVNLEGKIRLAAGVAKTAPGFCVIFDDVITTGSTMNACACALKAAGAGQVYGISLVYD
ncbi:MAG: double zinc ribbon domain-containing protein [Treponema sp.]|jgi:ComF family protein|nr:double zinc ribbon domain-containing protein [Treponema sp.]